MKKNYFIVFFVFSLFSVNIALGQEIVVTERGDSVVLFDDGTWDYYTNTLTDNDILSDIRENSEKFVKPESSQKVAEGSNNVYEVWYDNKKWKRTPAKEINSDADMSFKMIKGDVYSVIIYEELGFPLEGLIEAAIDNASSIAPDIKVVDMEYRMVNGHKMIFMRMDGSMKGLKISYCSYYFSSDNGAIQFHVFTGQSLIDKYKDDIEELLNGIVIKNM